MAASPPKLVLDSTAGQPNAGVPVLVDGIAFGLPAPSPAIADEALAQVVHDPEPAGGAAGLGPLCEG